jgi:hypothetical protein
VHHDGHYERRDHHFRLCGRFSEQRHDGLLLVAGVKDEDEDGRLFLLLVVHRELGCQIELAAHV